MCRALRRQHVWTLGDRMLFSRVPDATTATTSGPNSRTDYRRWASMSGRADGVFVSARRRPSPASIAKSAWHRNGAYGPSDRYRLRPASDASSSADIAQALRDGLSDSGTPVRPSWARRSCRSRPRGTIPVCRRRRLLRWTEADLAFEHRHAARWRLAAARQRVFSDPRATPESSDRRPYSGEARQRPRRDLLLSSILTATRSPSATVSRTYHYCHSRTAGVHRWEAVLAVSYSSRSSPVRASGLGARTHPTSLICCGSRACRPVRVDLAYLTSDK